MQRHAAQYQQNQVLTADPGQLLLLTYDGAIRFLREAAEAMGRRDLYRQSESIVRAQHLIMYLAGSLNHQANPELAGNLERIYHYLVDRLTAANVHDDRGGVDEALSLLGSLRQGWEQATGQAAEPLALGASA